MTSQPTLTKEGQQPGTTGEPQSSDGLQAGLKNRHLSMIAIGGVIGAGLFVGSGSGIAAAGPGILLSYALVGALVVFVMRMLGEMAAANPTSGSFSAYADRALGRWAGFSIGWLYWFFWVVVLAVEATAGAKILEGWVPGRPAVGLGADRDGRADRHQPGLGRLLRRVRVLVRRASRSSRSPRSSSSAGWRSSACCPAPTTPARASPTSPTTAASCRNGPGAILTGVLMVVFSFMGSEIVTLAAGESEDPQRAVTKATNSVIWRIGVFYLGSILVVRDAAAVGRPSRSPRRARTSPPSTPSASRTPARS